MGTTRRPQYSRSHRAIGDAATVQVLDLFELASPRLNAVMKKAYQNIVRFAPSLWSRIFAVFDNPRLFCAADSFDAQNARRTGRSSPQNQS